MAKLVPSSKRLLIDQANTTVVIVTGVAAFVLIFCAVATKTLMSQASYQNKVISAKRTAVKQLKADKDAVSTLKQSYTAFSSTTQNVLGGNPNGTGAQDGTNPALVLDALPSSYDFPALTTSLEKLISSQQVVINSITGTDDEVAQSSNTTSSTPQPIAMPFQISVKSNYGNLQSLVGVFERSIRPIQIQTLDISGNENDLTMNITAQTYYQPAKTLNIGTKVVK